MQINYYIKLTRDQVGILSSQLPQPLGNCHPRTVKVCSIMSGLRNTIKGGWHPEGKEGGKESWRGDFKGINQVVSSPLASLGLATRLAIGADLIRDIRLGGWERARKVNLLVLALGKPPNHKGVSEAQW